jgi:hypothetical protein
VPFADVVGGVGDARLLEQSRQHGEVEIDSVLLRVRKKVVACRLGPKRVTTGQQRRARGRTVLVRVERRQLDAGLEQHVESGRDGQSVHEARRMCPEIVADDNHNVRQRSRRRRRRC